MQNCKAGGTSPKQISAFDEISLKLASVQGWRHPRPRLGSKQEGIRGGMVWWKERESREEGEGEVTSKWLQTDRQTDRQTGRQTGRQAGRQTDRQRQVG